VHPLLVMNVVFGMTVEDLSEQAIAHLGYWNMTFPRWVYPGDTLISRSEVLDKRESGSKPDRGIVHVRTTGTNQRGEEVCMAELGYFGLIFSPDYGGSGLDTLSMAIVAEELSKAWLSVGSVMTRMIITASLVQANGTEEQKQKFLPGLCTGELLAAAAFTEPDAGSDSAGIKCRAVKKGDKDLITGEKTWCTWANKAHLLCTTVITNPEAQRKHDRISILLIPKTPGDEFHPPQLAGSPI